MTYRFAVIWDFLFFKSQEIRKVLFMLIIPKKFYNTDTIKNKEMRITMNFTCIFFGLVFVLAGIWFSFGKGYLNISAWKNMPSEEKEKIDIRALSRNVGAMISLCGLIFLIGGIFVSIFIWSMIAWLIIAGIDVYIISKTERYIIK